MDEKVNFADFSKKKEIWSVSDGKEGYIDSDPQTRLKKVVKDSKEEFLIVGEVNKKRNI